MYPQVAAPTYGSDSLIRQRDDKVLSIRVNGQKCWLYYLLGGSVLTVAGVLCAVLMFLIEINLWDATTRCLISGPILLIVGMGTKYMLLEADEEKLEVVYGPCSLYQNCLCCSRSCCCDHPLARGQLHYSNIRQVLVTQGDCHDGFGIHKKKYDTSCVHSVICCPSHVVEVHQEGGPTGCCRAGQKLRYAVESHEQAVELQTFLVSRAPQINGTLARNSGTINGPVNTVPTAPPTYDAVCVNTVPAYTLPPSTSFE